MKWITRERPKINRAACPWLIARCIDQKPKFVDVAAKDVLTVADPQRSFP